MISARPHLLPALAALALAVSGSALIAHPGGPGWAGPGWDSPGWRDHPVTRSSSPREGKVEVARFRADGDPATALGKGAITVTEAPAGGVSTPRELATYEAAVIDALARGGYDTATPAAQGGQIAEVRVLHSVAVPEEAPHKPVSGEMMMGMSNRGSIMGMALNVDMTKPRKALISTRLEARIKDRVSGTVLWEGRADVVTREGDSRWTDQKIAERLAGALFEGFPNRTGDQLAAR